MGKNEAIELLKLYKSVLERYIDFDKLYLYGSFAKGTNNNDSDIDVAIVVDKLDKDYFEITPLIWKLRRDIDLRIEPVILEKDKDHSGFLQEITDHGIEI
jgi:uncharacterized protein